MGIIFSRQTKKKNIHFTKMKKSLKTLISITFIFYCIAITNCTEKTKNQGILRKKTILAQEEKPQEDKPQEAKPQEADPPKIETKKETSLSTFEKFDNPYAGLNDEDIYYMNTVNFGQWGGLCTCPNGTSYRVADSQNECKSLNCQGGTQSQCHPVKQPRWMHMGVICGGKKTQNNILTNKPERYNRSDYNISAESRVKIQWN